MGDLWNKGGLRHPLLWSGWKDLIAAFSMHSLNKYIKQI